MALLHSTSLYITLPWLYFSLLASTLLYHGSTSLYLTRSTLLYYGSTSLNLTLPSPYFILLDSTLLYHGSTSFCFSLHYSTMALLFTA